MKILIDSSQVPIKRTGVGVYAERLILELASILDLEDRLFVLVQKDDLSLLKLIENRRNLTPITIPSFLFRNRLALALCEQFILPLILIYYRIDLVHSLHYTFPLLSPCCRVVTIHDMTFSLSPQMHTWGRRLIMPFFTKMALKYAEGVLFVSKSTQNDAARLFGAGANRRYVTPLGVDHAAFDKIQPEDVEETLRRLGINLPYILFLGTIEPRKNIIRLVQAFAMLGLQYSQYTLVIAGKLGWHYEATLQAIDHSPLSARICRLEFIAETDKTCLLAGCDLLVYPSLYEGFGLPVLEGMAAGVPVMTSNVSSLPEVAGEGAIMIDPMSLEQIATAMGLVLSDKTYSNKLRQAGKKQARKFSWDKTAHTTYAAYREISNS